MNPDSAAIVTTCSKEARYLIEWVAHYSLLGFERFYIFEHENPQDEEFLSVKSTLESTGIVTFHEAVRTEATEDIQMDTYNSALALTQAEGIGWLFACDLDEYLVLRRHTSITHLLSEMPERVQQVIFSWRMYGSSGELTYDPSRVHFERFQTCAFELSGLNRSGKGIVRTNKAIKMGLHFHAVPGISIGGDLRIHDQVGKYHIQTPLYDVGILLHFGVRSREEFEAKQVRGYASEWHEQKIDEGYWERRNANEVLGPDLSKQSGLLHERMMSWMGGEFAVNARDMALESGRTPKAKIPKLRPGVPSSITNWRARVVLEVMGLTGMIEQIVDSMTGDEALVVRNAWRSGADLDRLGPSVIAFTHQLGLTEDQVDQLFIQASKLTV